MTVYATMKEELEIGMLPCYGLQALQEMAGQLDLGMRHRVWGYFHVLRWIVVHHSFAAVSCLTPVESCSCAAVSCIAAVAGCTIAAESCLTADLSL